MKKISKSLRLTILIATIFSFASNHKLSAIFDFSFFSKPKRTGFLPSILESKEIQLKDLEEMLISLKKESADATTSVNRRLNEVTDQITAAETLQKNQNESDFLGKKVNLLNERKQNLIAIKETWSEAEEILQKHISLVIETIDTLKNKRQTIDTKLFYLKDLRESYAKIGEISHSLRAENSKKESLIKQKRAEEEDLSSILKKIEETKEDQKKILDRILQPSENEDVSRLKEKEELIEITNTLIQEQKERADISIRKLDLEIKYIEDLVKKLESNLSQTKRRISFIQSQLYIDQKDVETAKEELEKEIARAIVEKNNYNKQREAKKTEKRRWKVEQIQLDTKIKQLTESGQQNSPEAYLLNARYEKIDNLLRTLDKEIEHLYAAKDLEDTKVTLKRLQTQLVQITYKLQTDTYDKTDLAKWNLEFSKAKAKEENEIKYLDEKRTEISNFTAEHKLKIDELKSKIEEIKSKKDDIFKTNSRAFIETLAALSDAQRYLERQINSSQDIFLKNSELIRYKREIANQYELLLRAIEAKRQFDIWTPSAKSIKIQDLNESFIESTEFVKEIVWRLPTYMNPLNLWNLLKTLSFYDFMGLILMILFVLIAFAGIHFLLTSLVHILSSVSNRCKNSRCSFIFELVASLLNALVLHYFLFFTWLFVQMDLLVGFKRYLGPLGNFPWITDSAYLVTCVYLLSIPLFLMCSEQIINKLIDFNARLGFKFYKREMSQKFLTILRIIFYSSSVLLPLRQAFLTYSSSHSKLPLVIWAAYTLIIEAILISFVAIHKEVLIKLIPTSTRSLRFFKDFFEQNYNLIVIFFLVLAILANPYVGYSNLAYLSLYSVPISVLICYALFYIHASIRKYSAYWFISEEDEEVVDLFDHAKTYFGIFVILSFLLLLFIAFLLIAFIWGVRFPLETLQYLLQEKWTLEITDAKKLGILDFVIVTLFIAGGFLLSTLVDKFLLTKLFDILRMDLGVRNTISSILHYIIIYIVIVFGLTSVSLGGYVFWISSVLLAGIAFAAQDFLKDFIAGFLILLERPIEIGNFIEVDHKIDDHPTRGTVLKISARSTSVRTVNNHLIVIPNRELISKPISNWGYGRTTVGFELTVHVAYGSDTSLVFKLLSEVFYNDPRIMRIPAPTYRLEDFGESGFKFFIRSFISARRVREQWDIASDLRVGIVNIFRKYGIRIPLPHRVIHFSDELGNAPQGQGPITIKFDKE